jgi:hypothetical protein
LIVGRAGLLVPQAGTMLCETWSIEGPQGSGGSAKRRQGTEGRGAPTSATWISTPRPRSLAGHPVSGRVLPRGPGPSFELPSPLGGGLSGEGPAPALPLVTSSFLGAGGTTMQPPALLLLRRPDGAGLGGTVSAPSDRREGDRAGAPGSGGPGCSLAHSRVRKPVPGGTSLGESHCFHEAAANPLGRLEEGPATMHSRRPFDGGAGSGARHPPRLESRPAPSLTTSSTRRGPATAPTSWPPPLRRAGGRLAASMRALGPHFIAPADGAVSQFPAISQRPRGRTGFPAAPMREVRT